MSMFGLLGNGQVDIIIIAVFLLGFITIIKLLSYLWDQWVEDEEPAEKSETHTTEDLMDDDETKYVED